MMSYYTIIAVCNENTDNLLDGLMMSRYGFNSVAARRIFAGEATDAEISSFALGLQWCSAPVTTCQGELIGWIKGLKVIEHGREWRKTVNKSMRK